ncbi:MAG: arylamine N-acetyltransferase [Alphaproteobacteria bacterium]|nr:arylamine N-acetyltransferase [Alphaproteobacteria bacterium]
MSIDLDAYFRRIGYDGPREAKFETLGAINRLHPQAIAFENLDPLMGVPVPLDTASLERKLVRAGRGGYCYEHNLLLGEALKALGFAVTGLAGRVIKDPPATGPRARTHMLLKLDLDGNPHIVDVGFGIAALTAPVRLEPDIAQPTPHETVRLIETDGEFEMQAQVGGAWVPLYRFDLQEQLLQDYEVCNWYMSTHPSSQFVAELMVSRADAGCRHALRGNRYTLRPGAGPAEARTIDTVADMRKTLQEVFRITLPDTGQLDEALRRIVAG